MTRALDLSAVPAELRDLPRWVGWRLEERPGDPKPTKVPVNARTGGLADSTDPKTWSTFAAAVAAVERFQLDGGVGFVFTLEDGIVGVDLDHVLDPVTGTIEPWAASVVQRLHSYTETSPSGDGLHILVRGELPAGGNKCKGGRKGCTAGHNGATAFEAYARSRFFTVTGAKVEGAPGVVEERSAELAAIHGEHFPKRKSAPSPPRPAVPVDLDDQALLDRAIRARNGERFRALWEGDMSDHAGDHSAADLALCSRLAFWTGGDAGRVDRLFRQSALMRPKWDEGRGAETYGERTIRVALAGARDHYTPTGGQPMSDARGSANQPHHTDCGNAQRLVRAHGADLRYCHPLRHWFVWDGARWAPDTTGEVMRRAKATARAMLTEAAAIEDPDRRAALAKHAMSSERRDRLAAMVALAESEPGIAVQIEDLDCHPWLLATPGVTVDLMTGESYAPRREDLLSRIAGVAYDPAAECPTWLGFLDQIFAGDTDLINYMQRVLGQALTGVPADREFWFLYGSGRNGKSTLLGLLENVLGEYATRIDAELLLAGRQRAASGPTPELLSLRGARAVIAGELPAGRALDEARIKDLTGRDRITARGHHADPVTFPAIFKLFLAGNHRPKIHGTDAAIWDRVRLVPFLRRISDEAVDHTLPARLRAESVGVLGWMVAGAVAWHRAGAEAPAAVSAATEAYRTAEDVLGRFLAERCVVASAAAATAAELLEAYRGWSGDARMSARALGEALAERGFRRAQVTAGPSKGRVGWSGVGLLTVEGRGSRPLSHVFSHENNMEKNMEKSSTILDSRLGSTGAPRPCWRCHEETTAENAPCDNCGWRICPGCAACARGCAEAEATQ